MGSVYTFVPKEKPYRKEDGMGVNNNASKSNKLLYLYLTTILELCVDKRLDTMMTKINN